MSLFRKIIEGRQRRANHFVAEQLMKTEYKGETLEYVLGKIESGTLYE